MGNKQTSENFNEYVHERLGPVKMINSNVGGEEVTTMQKVYPVTNQKEFENWTRSVSKIKNTETSEVLFLPIKSQYEKAGICGSSGHATLVFEDYIFVLDNEIKNRNRLNKYFSETEVWYLLYNCIRAAKQFQKIGEKVGDIKPANIVINQDGQIKLISTRTRPGQLTNFDKAIESRTQEVYLAPQQCNEQYIKTAHYPSSVDKNVAQIFSIGLTILEAATLENCASLYKRNDNYEFDEYRFQNIKAELGQNYSEPLTSYIHQMIHFNPALRPKASKLYADLHPYEAEILNLEEFQFVNQNPRNSQRHTTADYYGTNVQTNYQPQSYQNQNYQPQYQPQHQQYTPQYNYQPISQPQSYYVQQNQVPPVSYQTTYQSRPI